MTRNPRAGCKRKFPPRCGKWPEDCAPKMVRRKVYTLWEKPRFEWPPSKPGLGEPQAPKDVLPREGTNVEGTRVKKDVKKEKIPG